MKDTVVFDKIRDHDNNHIKVIEKIANLENRIAILEAQTKQTEKRKEWQAYLVSGIIGGAIVALFKKFIL